MTSRTSRYQQPRSLGGWAGNPRPPPNNLLPKNQPPWLAIMILARFHASAGAFPGWTPASLRLDCETLHTLRPISGEAGLYQLTLRPPGRLVTGQQPHKRGEESLPPSSPGATCFHGASGLAATSLADWGWRRTCSWQPHLGSLRPPLPVFTHQIPGMWSIVEGSSSDHHSYNRDPGRQGSVLLDRKGPKGYAKLAG